MDDKNYFPMNVYGQTKLEDELAVSGTLEKYCMVHIAWGVQTEWKEKTMINVGKTHPVVCVVNEQSGAPAYTYDLAWLLIDMIETEKYGYYSAHRR